MYKCIKNKKQCVGFDSTYSCLSWTIYHNKIHRNIVLGSLLGTRGSLACTWRKVPVKSNLQYTIQFDPEVIFSDNHTILIHKDNLPQGKYEILNLYPLLLDIVMLNAVTSIVVSLILDFSRSYSIVLFKRVSLLQNLNRTFSGFGDWKEHVFALDRSLQLQLQRVSACSSRYSIETA